MRIEAATIVSWAPEPELWEMVQTTGMDGYLVMDGECNRRFDDTQNT